ncbi:hypothetical protein ACFU3E_33850 [Streptomyces sp. NPDC057424]|uniref:hypothetical protein n=1 Tax=Streptomyces sp. NPDC057424 TaxID=3346127 RepID=UPI0036849F40
MSPAPAPLSARIAHRTLLEATAATAGAIAGAAALAGLGAPAHAAAGFGEGVGISRVPQTEARGCSWKNCASPAVGWTGASSTRASPVACAKALTVNGGQGIFHGEPERMAPFTGRGMGAWDSSSRRPTVIINGFTQA